MADEKMKTKTQVSIGAESAQLKTLTFDEIKIGDELPAYTKWITFRSAARFGSTYDDAFSGHLNPDVANDYVVFHETLC